MTKKRNYSTTKTPNTMKKEKLKVMRGSVEHTDLVRKWMEEQGADLYSKPSDQFAGYCNFDYFYVINGKWNFITVNNPLLDYLNYEVVELETND